MGDKGQKPIDLTEGQIASLLENPFPLEEDHSYLCDFTEESRRQPSHMNDDSSCISRSSDLDDLSTEERASGMSEELSKAQVMGSYLDSTPQWPHSHGPGWEIENAMMDSDCETDMVNDVRDLLPAPLRCLGDKKRRGGQFASQSPELDDPGSISRELLRRADSEVADRDEGMKPASLASGAAIDPVATAFASQSEMLASSFAGETSPSEASGVSTRANSEDESEPGNETSGSDSDYFAPKPVRLPRSVKVVKLRPKEAKTRSAGLVFLDSAGFDPPSKARVREWCGFDSGCSMEIATQRCKQFVQEIRTALSSKTGQELTEWKSKALGDAKLIVASECQSCTRVKVATKVRKDFPCETCRKRERTRKERKKAKGLKER